MTTLTQQSQCRPASFVTFCTAHNRAGCACLGNPRVSLPTAPGDEEVRTQRKIGDRVFVVADNYGSECTIIAYRDSDPPMASHWQVRTKSGDRFWALDYEISEVT